MLIESPPSADAGAARLPGSATFPAPPLPSPPATPPLSATAPYPSEAADQALAKYLGNLKLGIARLTAEREALAGRVEQLAALNFETAGELARAREEQAREAARATARAESSATGLKQLQERVARLSGQFQEVQSAVELGAARNATLAELAKRAQEELPQLARERQAALARAEEATAAFRRMQQERDALRGELAALMAENKELLARVMRVEGGSGSAAPEPAGVRAEMIAGTGGAAAPENEEVADPFADIFTEEATVFPKESPLTDEAPLVTGEARLCNEEAPLPHDRWPEETGQQGSAGAAEVTAILHHLPSIAEPLPEPTPASQAAPEFPSFPGFGDDLFFGNADPEELPSFVLQPRLQRIECGGADEVVSLYRPVNVANVSLDGKGQEICQGYICCIRRESGTEVFAAIVGVKSGQIRIYAPEEQPRDDEATTRAVRGAVAFGEQVGLVMEENAGESAEQRIASARRCPVMKFSAER